MSGSGCGDLAELHEVAVVADRVGAELVLVAVAVVAVLLPAPLPARGERSRWSPRAPSCGTSAASPRGTTRGGERLGVAVLAELLEVAVVADRVGAELAVVAVAVLAVLPAPSSWWSPIAAAAVVTSPHCGTPWEGQPPFGGG